MQRADVDLVQPSIDDRYNEAVGHPESESTKLKLLVPNKVTVTSERADVSAERQDLTAAWKRLHDSMMIAVDGAFQGAETAVDGVRELLASWHRGVKPSAHDLSCAHAACVDFLRAVRNARGEVAKELDRVKRAE
jgi:hypothetical protein